MFLYEVFNNSVPFTVKDLGSTIVGQFDVDQYSYEVTLVQSYPKSKQGLQFLNNLKTDPKYASNPRELYKIYPCYILSFEIVNGLSDEQIARQDAKAHDEGDEDGKYELSDTGNQFIVFSTIIEFLKTVIKMKDNRVLEFSFSGKGESRNSLYGRMVDKLADRIGFTSNTAGLSKYVTYDQNFLIINKEIA